MPPFINTKPLKSPKEVFGLANNNLFQPRTCTNGPTTLIAAIAILAYIPKDTTGNSQYARAAGTIVDRFPIECKHLCCAKKCLVREIFIKQLLRPMWLNR